MNLEVIRGWLACMVAFKGRHRTLLGRSTGAVSYLKAESGVSMVAAMVACELVFVSSSGSLTVKLRWLLGMCFRRRGLVRRNQTFPGETWEYRMPNRPTKVVHKSIFLTDIETEWGDGITSSFQCTTSCSKGPFDDLFSSEASLPAPVF